MISEPLRQRAQSGAQPVRAAVGNPLFDFGVRPNPYRICLRKKPASRSRNGQPPAPFVFRIDRNLSQSPAFKGLEGRCKRRAIHREQRRYAADRRRFRPVERHQKGKLTLRKTEGPKDVIEMPCQSPGSALHVQTKAGVAHLMGGGKR